MSIDNTRPLNPFNRRSLRLRINGKTTLRNEGYWGMNILQGETYQARLAARAANGFQGPITLALENQTGTTWPGRNLRAD